MERTVISAPEGAVEMTYNYAVRTGQIVWMAGQLALDGDGNVVGTTPGEQAAKCMDNLEATLAAAGATLDDVVMVRTYVTHWANRDAVKAEIQKRFGDKRPPSTTLVVAALGFPECQCEIEATAVVAGNGNAA